MNETFWIVVHSTGAIAPNTFAWWPETSIEKYIVEYCTLASKEGQQEWWEDKQKQGARCVKVRLVLEE